MYFLWTNDRRYFPNKSRLSSARHYFRKPTQFMGRHKRAVTRQNMKSFLLHLIRLMLGWRDLLKTDNFDNELHHHYHQPEKEKEIVAFHTKAICQYWQLTESYRTSNNGGNVVDVITSSIYIFYVEFRENIYTPLWWNMNTEHPKPIRSSSSWYVRKQAGLEN